MGDKTSHIKISGGENELTITHGQSTGNDGEETTVTFPETLPHVPSVVLTARGDPGNVWITAVSTTQFTWLNNTGEDTITVDWIAVT